MGRFRRYEIIEHSPSFFLKETSIFAPRRSLLLNPCFNFPSFPIVEHQLDLDYSTLDLLNLVQSPSLLLDDLDLIQIDETPFFHTRRRVAGLEDLYLEALSDRVSALELGLGRVLKEDKCGRKKKIGESKYTWTAEIKSPEKDRKYKWEAEKKGVEKSYKWTAEIKRKGEESPIEQTYTIKVSTGKGKSKSEDSDKKEKKSKEKAPRIVEIEEPSDNGGIVLRQV